MARETTLAECAQALFCALAEYANIKKPNDFSKLFDKNVNKDFLTFDKSWSSTFKNSSEAMDKIYEKFTRAGDKSSILPYADIKDFLVLDKSWFISSLIIAEKFVTDVGKVPGLQSFAGNPSLGDIWFYRGDTEVMGSISILFSIANKNSGDYFGDLNKWSPADIYFATKTAKKEIKDQLNYYDQPKNRSQYGFDILNNLVSTLIEQGDLLPISLKKTTKGVIIKPVNFDRAEEEQAILEYQYYGIRQDWKKSTRSKPQTRDLQVRFSSNAKDYLQLRHDASNGESSDGFKCEVLGGGEAKGGGVSSIKVFSKILSKIDKTAGEKFEQIWRKGSTEYRKVMKPKREKLNSDLKTSKNAQVKKKIKDDYDVDRGIESALNVTNDAFSFFKDWLEKNSSKGGESKFIFSPADRFVQETFKYVTSRTEKSGKFIIMKG